MSFNMLALLIIVLNYLLHQVDGDSQNSTNFELKTSSHFLRENCRCSSQWQCECCAKVNNDLLNVHQKLCLDWRVFSKSLNVQANVRLNENVLYTNTFSAWSIPPFCVPLWPALAITGCLQLHSIGQHEFNTLHICGNATINFISFTLINWPIGCMDIGAGGVQTVAADHDIVMTNTNEKPPEIELETSDFLQNSNIKNKIFANNNKWKNY